MIAPFFYYNLEAQSQKKNELKKGLRAANNDKDRGLFTFITRGTTSQRLGSISFSFLFFLHVAISDSGQWLPYLGFVPGTMCTTSKGLMSPLSKQI